MRPKVLFVLAMIISLPTLASSAPKPPPAPEGFSWKRIAEIKAAFLMPDGWFFKSEAAGGTLAYFFTAEKIEKGGQFETGLTINVFKNLKDKDARAYAEAFAAKTAEQHEAIRKWEVELGSLHGFGVITRQAGKEGVPTIVVSTLAIGNSRTNTLYLLLFESPESRWEAEWRKGEKMFELFFLDDEG